MPADIFKKIPEKELTARNIITLAFSHDKTQILQAFIGNNQEEIKITLQANVKGHLVPMFSFAQTAEGCFTIDITVRNPDAYGKLVHVHYSTPGGERVEKEDGSIRLGSQDNYVFSQRRVLTQIDSKDLPEKIKMQETVNNLGTALSSLKETPGGFAPVNVVDFLASNLVRA